MPFAAVGEATDWLLTNGFADTNDAMAGCVPHRRMWGVALGGWLLARAAAAVGADSVKGVLSAFYDAHVLPQARACLPGVTAGG